MKISGKDSSLIRILGIETLAERYRAEYRIGSSFGGSTFKGVDTASGSPVFIKYLICPRGEIERAKFMMELDALRHIEKAPFDKVAPKVLYFNEFDRQQTLALVTEWVNGELLSTWIERSGELSLQERLAVFHRVAYAMSTATRSHQHRDFHPGNIMLLSEDLVRMGPQFEHEARSAVKVLDWGEALPVIMGTFYDEPDHYATMLAEAPRMIGGSFTSRPPEVFQPWNFNYRSGGTYESWGLGMLLFRILTQRPLTAPASLGDYASEVHSGRLKILINRRTYELYEMDLPGGLILPRLFKWMMDDNPKKRASLADIARVLWDLRYEELSFENIQDLEIYFKDPRGYEPPAGWRFSSVPEYY
ncbi:serine/threonine protein kinase [Delftia sp. Cs1-4]|uniref:protein kinase domain-containing protein n=1 Tax=Delftia sp. (strain Cs1-4) TaxID=742013 RepID=UPI00020E807E|nr:protein kinase [Delftia sp. Cs1-4]AEF90854.1 serine/threonine protein kinase [Delftia sp. Cs1-4]